LPFDASDPVWLELRDMPLSASQKRKKEWLEDLDNERDKFQEMKKRGELKDIKQFMKDGMKRILKEEPLLEAHHFLQTRIQNTVFKESTYEWVKPMEVIQGEQALYRDRWYAEQRVEAMDLMEELIDKKQEISRVLRVMCLASLTSGGLNPDDLEQLKTGVQQTYGYESIWTLQALEQLGALSEGRKRFAGLAESPFDKVKAAMALVGDNVVDDMDEDITYTYLWYAPLTARIVQRTLQPQWDGAKAVPGHPFVDHGRDHADIVAGKRELKSLVVFFLGGCTRCEVAGIRFLARKLGLQICVITTGMITGGMLIDAVSSKANGIVMGQSGASHQESEPAQGNIP